jgi:hypothetical protein
VTAKLEGLTYVGLAERFGVEICTGWCGEGGHNDGWWGGKRIHFRERRVTRGGLRKFLMLVHDATVWSQRAAGNQIDRKARWIHSRNVWAYQTAFHELGIRLPRSLSSDDRARVRHLTYADAGSQTLRRWAREE